MRWFSIAVLSYMILGIMWWGMLLFSKNGELYDEKLRAAATDQIAEIESERNRQNLMIIGEGVVLGLSLLAGIYIINRSASREIKAAKQQSNFLLSVSHELKSPIAAIKLALETMTRPKFPKESVASVSKTAVKDADRLEKLVQNILLSASIEDSRLELYKEKTDLSILLLKAIEKYQNNGKQIIIKFHSNTSQVEAAIDRLNINQALSNLLDNAVKYSVNNSEIEVTLDSTKSDIQISITNEGSNINEQEKDFLFKKFYRGQNQEIRSKEGTGIGLYIANEIIKAHDGLLSVTNLPDNRVCFTIQLSVAA